MKNIFKDKVVVITGASSGIGEATAREFAKSGSKVVLAARSEDLAGCSLKAVSIQEESICMAKSHISSNPPHCY